MYLSELNLTEQDIKQYEVNSKTSDFRSSFNFFNCHRGIRKNKMHLLIAPTSAGKSTFVRSVLCDLVFRNKDKKVLLWLTEESIEDFKQEFSATVPANDVLKNITMISEMGTNPNEDEVRGYIEEAIGMVNPDIVICDNITTSRLYMDKTNSQQAEISMWIKELTRTTTFFIIAHTNGDGYESKFINENDIRGSKTLPNLVEFLYVLQPIRVGDRLFQFVNIIKHRGQPISGKFFRLFYDERIKSFEKDSKISFEEIKDVFKQRNSLSGK